MAGGAKRDNRASYSGPLSCEVSEGKRGKGEETARRWWHLEIISQYIWMAAMFDMQMAEGDCAASWGGSRREATWQPRLIRSARRVIDVAAVNTCRRPAFSSCLRPPFSELRSSPMAILRSVAKLQTAHTRTGLHASWCVIKCSRGRRSQWS